MAIAFLNTANVFVFETIFGRYERKIRRYVFRLLSSVNHKVKDANFGLFLKIIFENYEKFSQNIVYTDTRIEGLKIYYLTYIYFLGRIIRNFL